MERQSIARIPLRQSEAFAPERWRACLWVGYALEHALQCGYRPEDLPADARRFADLWEYSGEVSNGGHAQYRDNEEESLPRLPSMAALLEEIGLPDHGSLLREFEEFSIAKDDEIFELQCNGDEDGALAARELFYPFDDRFAELERSEGKLVDHLAGWLIRQPWIALEAGDEPADIDWLHQAIANSAGLKNLANGKPSPDA